MIPHQKEARALIRREALVSAAVNLVINASISGWMLMGKGPHPLTVDSIAAKEHTVFGSAVPLAVILSLILATITFFTFRKKAEALGFAPAQLLQRPYFFFGLRQALQAALVMFGSVVAAGVLWQRAFGTLTVTTPVAAAIAGSVAGLAAWYACTSTAHAMLRDT
jgi:hypothetical protein